MPTPDWGERMNSLFDDEIRGHHSMRDLSRFTDEELHIDRIDRGHGFVASPFVQHQVYREAVYIFYGKLSVYLQALERDAGEEWAAWVG